ncbi:MAG: hypothetical protein V7641_3718 [Blastocatellia bacterium]
MSRRMMCSSALLVCLFGLLCLNNPLEVRGAPPAVADHEAVAEPSPQTVDCKDPKAVAQAVYDKLKSDSNLKDQVESGQLNVFFDPTTKRITLIGWAVAASKQRGDKSAVNQAKRLAGLATHCERSVNVKRLGIIKPLQCSDGEVPCGRQGFCVPAGTCTLPPRTQ